MNNIIMNYNPEQAVKASGSEYLSQGGAVVIKITRALYGSSTQKGTKYIEFSGVSASGEKIGYLKCYYQKKDVNDQPGDIVTGGWNTIQAMMGICGIRSITAAQDGQEWICQEFNEKLVGLFLQKKLYTKSDGKDGYSFDIKLPYEVVTGKTLRETANNSQASTVSTMQKSYADIDERNSQPQQNGFDGVFQPAGPDVGDGPRF